MEGIDTSLAGPTVPEAPDYKNPLETSSRWYLTARAGAIRYAASLGFSISNRVEPPAPAPTREIWFDSTLSKWKGRRKIKVEIWIPPKPTSEPRAAVVSLHGGGWILGQGTDDARWAAAAMNSTDAVVFTVNYRLAPSYPYPTPVEDCVDAIIQIAARANEFAIDPNQIIISGFSAGACNALTSWIVMQTPEKWGYKLPKTPPAIAGLVLFYPLLDWTRTRPEKRMTCARPDLTLPKGLTDLIDASYVYPSIAREERTDARLSPGLMSDALVQKLPPVHLCLCEYDMLLAEGITFARRLEQQNKTITLRVVKEEKHAWDCPPPMTPKESVAVEYREATNAMSGWLGREISDTDAESITSVRSIRSLRSLKRYKSKLRPSYMSLRSRSTRF